jgi:predicted phage-related endonuclease
MALSPEQIERRRNFVGGSDANILVKGDPIEIENLRLFKTNIIGPPDLDGVLQIQLGSFTEAFNRFWFSKNTGHEVTNDGDERMSLDFPFMSCTLDGLVRTENATYVFEAKHVSAFANLEEVIERYYPQLQHNIFVTGADGAFLSVIFGNHKWEIADIPRDEDFIKALLDIETEFWRCVEADQQYMPLPAPKPAILATVKRDMQGHNEWASAAVDWLENKAAAKKFTDATAALKGLVEDEVVEAYGHGVTAKRAKNNAISIRESK